MVKRRTAIRHLGFWFIGLSLATGIFAALWAHRPVDSAPAENDFPSILRAWDRATENAFPPVDHPREELSFPRDHAAHPASPFELWEAVALLHSGGERFLVRFRLTRLGASLERPVRASQWAAHEFVRGELTAGNINQNALGSARRNSRVALGMAGHTRDPPRVWIDGDSLQWTPDGAAGEVLLVSLRENEISADLRFAVAKPRVASTESGKVPGLWSGYLYPRLRVSGDLRLRQEKHGVEGSGWLVHNWGPLPPLGGQVVFDRWFVQFDQGQDMVLLQTRRRDGTGQPSQRGVWIEADGRVENLDPGELRLELDDLVGNRPDMWALRSNDGRLAARIETILGGSEGVALEQGWVGGLRVEGVSGGKAVTGWGFVELSAN